MTVEDQTAERLVDWVQARDRGHEMSAQELCRDCPEVQQQIDDLKSTDSMFEDDEGFLSLPDSRTQSTEQDDTAEIMTSLSLGEFTSCVISAGLLTADQLSSFQSGLSSPVDATELARQLVRKQRLTMFQATAICEGKADGLVYGDYVILDRIGAGGMGQVFKARHRRMKRVVALKILPPEAVATPNAVGRFEREVEAAARLIHPNIVTAYDAREDKGVHYLVMECVEGSDLSSLVKNQGPLSVTKAINYIKQAATGLAFAHGKGVVHRDIKPANLLLDGEGVVKILDMGLARLEQPMNDNGIAVTQAELTQDGSVLGTIDYLPPEQALDTKHADGRADIYSLGCTLYYLLTGGPVYPGSTLMARLLAHREADIPSLAKARPGVPVEIDSTFKKMVAKEPGDRYQTATDLLADLETIHVADDDDVHHGTSVAAETYVDVVSKGTSLTALDETIDLVPKRVEETSALKPTPASKGRVIFISGIVALAALLLGGVYLAVVILRVETPEGTVLVEIGNSDKPVEVSVLKDDTIKIMDPNDGKEVLVTVEAGKKTLTLRKEGFALQTETFSLKSKDGRSVKVSFVPAAVPTSEPELKDASIDRKVAKYILGRRGSVYVCPAGKTPEWHLQEGTWGGYSTNDWVKSEEQLPQGEFFVFGVCIEDNPCDEDMNRLVSCRFLEFLSIQPYNSLVTDSGIAQIGKLPRLTQLWIAFSKITDAGLKHLSGLTELTHLDIGATQISGEGIGYLKNLHKLQFLSLWRVQGVSDASLGELAGLPDLHFINLMVTSISDAGLEHLAKIKSLKRLPLNNTQVSDVGVAKLQQALPECKIER